VREYDAIFDWYVTERSSVIGLREVEELTRSLPMGACVLDLGCGTGIPIAQFLIGAGFDVFGIDSSPKMTASFQQQFPRAHTACERIEESEFFGCTFDAIVSWGVMFHLDRAAQERVIARTAASLNENGKFLFTSGEEEGTAEGVMNGITFRYISLGADTYERLLNENGLELLHRGHDKADNYVYLARKRN
jgi:cyclopropane fatty-acyl-phospholipid synthase-like methyltransferase